MEKNSVWTKWAQNLHRWGIDGPAEVFLNSIGPVSIVFAQSLILIKPLFSSSNEWDILAEMIEDPSERKAFSGYLQEGNWDE
jgi:hypothetical protein